MKTKLTVIFLMMSMVISLSGCFPNGKKVNNNGDFEKISVEKLADLPKHVDEKVNNNLVINADVNIEVKNNFNTYTANSYDLDIEKWCELFFKDEKAVEKNDFAGEMSVRDYKNANAVKYINTNYSYNYTTNEFQNKNMQYYLDLREINRNGLLNAERDTLFAKKEMDFMGSEAAKDLADQKLKQLGISNITDYKIYSVSYDYIKKVDDYELKEFQELGLADEKNARNHVKDDEFYVIIPKFSMPNGSSMAEIEYKSPDQKKNVYCGVSFAAVDKKGIAEFELKGLYNIAEEKSGAKEIISLNSALGTVKGKYSDSMTAREINNIEFSYVPYLVNEEQRLFELKPTWIFSAVTETGQPNAEITGRKRNVTLIDATSGEEFEIYSEI